MRRNDECLVFQVLFLQQLSPLRFVSRSTNFWKRQIWPGGLWQEAQESKDRQQKDSRIIIYFEAMTEPIIGKILIID